MEALAADLAGVAPDLARQFASSRPTVRRNSGFGVFTEVAVDPGQATSGATGDFGSAHVMIAGLAEPIAFTARLRQGRLMGLMGDSYGQDTRAVDFAAVYFTQVFSVDASGRSIPFAASSAPPPQESPRPNAQPAAPRPATSVPNTAQASTSQSRRADADHLRRVLQAAGQSPAEISGALRRAQDQVRADQDTALANQNPTRPAAAGATAPLVDATPTKEDRTSQLIGLYVAAAAVALILIFVFDWNPIFVAIAAFWIANFFRKPKNLSAAQRALKQVETLSAQRR